METDTYIEVKDWYFITAKQTEEVQIKMNDNNGKPFIAKLYNVLLEPDLWDRIFYNIMLMNSGHTWLFHRGLCTIFFSENE